MIRHECYATGGVIAVCDVSSSPSLNRLKLACEVLCVRVPDDGAVFKRWSYKSEVGVFLHCFIGDSKISAKESLSAVFIFFVILWM